MELCGTLLSCVELCETVWSCVELCEAVWNCVELCGAVWNCVELCGAVWNCVELCGAVWNVIWTHIRCVYKLRATALDAQVQFRSRKMEKEAQLGAGMLLAYGDYLPSSWR